MRNIVVHHYFETDLGVVWQVVVSDIPRLKGMILRLMEDPEGHA